MATSERARFDAFDVVAVSFPYADRLAEKRRPALVVSNRRLAIRGWIWVAMITSAENEPWSSDVAVTDLRHAGLPTPRWCGRRRSPALIQAASTGGSDGSTGRRLGGWVGSCAAFLGEGRFRPSQALPPGVASPIFNAADRRFWGPPLSEASIIDFYLDRGSGMRSDP